jgi:hypothetical protein
MPPWRSRYVPSAMPCASPRARANLAKWKAFDFFDVSPVRLADDETRNFFESNEISSLCSGSDSLFLGSYDGFVRIVGPSWKVVRSFQAHDTGTITHLRQVEGTSLLVTVAVRFRCDILYGGAALNVYVGGPEQRAGTQGVGARQARQEDEHADVPEHCARQQRKEAVSSMPSMVADAGARTS